ncbi:MAG TPA: outer membrane beta-barrel protein [Chitinophagales bacterium]|nr:outer membrane beta-barrel protein [Chitinophagales bacterium]HRK26647.1 outer membrane beta-barrel protein [Chitinophagales bacterium]
MKKVKVLSVLFLSLAFSSAVFAQKGLEFGVRVLPQSVWIINDDDAARGDGLDYTRTWGMAYGINAGYNFLNFLGFQTGILFSGQGQKYVGDGSSGFETMQTKLNYAKIPLLLKFNSNPDAGAYFVGTAGVQLGLLTGAKLITDDEEVDFSGIGYEYKDAFTSTDLSAAFSLGSRFRLTDNLNLGLSLRADYSLGDIQNRDLKVLGIPVYDANRATSANLTGGILLEFNYLLGN